jgi:hypothetical protein
MDVTVFVIRRICENLGITGTPLADVAEATLSSALVRYPDGEVHLQTNGQLMGHPLSFPILCIINLSTYMRTTLRAEPEDLRDAPFLINGDDIVFRGEVEEYHRWREVAGEVGLIVNELKTYVHPKFNMINSIRHFHDREIYYQNIALSIGHRVKSEPIRMLTAAQQSWELLGKTEVGVNHLRRNFLNSLVKKLPRLLFEGRRFSPNFFLPKEFGGLGLRNDGRKFYITKDQRRLATWCLRNPFEPLMKEILGSQKTSCAAAIRLAKRISPAVEPWCVGSESGYGRPIHGPLNKHEDAEYWTKKAMLRAIRFTAYIRNTEPSSEDHVFRMFLRKASKWKETPISAQKLKRYLPHRVRIPTAINPPLLSETGAA